MKISVVGTGYVGLVAGVCFADAGHNVLCVDKDPSKIEKLKQSIIPIYEPGLEDLLNQCMKREKISFTTEIEKAVSASEVIFVAVGTPPKADGTADLSATFAVLESIAKNATTEKYVVLKSTVPIGTCLEAQKFLDENSQQKLEIINNPEFLKEGAAIDDFLRPDRIVIGCKSARAKELMEELYEPFVKNGHPILFMDNLSAEMTKYAANSFLSVKISFINELSRLADKVGADINAVRKGFTSDSRINPSFFYPGIGFGGSCFPKDVQALIQTGDKFDSPLKIVKSAYEANWDQKNHLLQMVKNHFKDLKGKKICLWGLAFKPKTDDVREAPSLFLIEELTKLGAEVVAFDPIAFDTAKEATDTKFTIINNQLEATKNCDALVVVTEWNQFKNPDYAALKSNLKSPIIFDGRNIYNPEKMQKLGFDYYCIGRQALTRSIT